MLDSSGLLSLIQILLKQNSLLWTDVEKEKQASQAEAEELQKFQLAVENASDQIIITDPEGIVLYANQAIEKTIGFPRSETLGRKVQG